MGAKGMVRCSNCQRPPARADALGAEPAALKQLVAQPGPQLAAARKHPSTSSQPPSSDPVEPPEPPPPEGRDQRRIGGRPGPPKHERVASPPEAINRGSIDHHLDSCPSCGQDLQPALTIAPRVVQPVDIREVPPPLEEHRSHPGWCPHRQKMYEAPLPPRVAPGGLIGPPLAALIAPLEGACHASCSTIRTSRRDAVRVTVSRGEPARIIAKVSRAPGRPSEGVLEGLPTEARRNVAETGPKPDGVRMWAWCFRAGLDTSFKVDPTRSADVSTAALGTELNGALGRDSSSAYRRDPREFGVPLQFCPARRIRGVKYLTTPPDARGRASGGARARRCGSGSR